LVKQAEVGAAVKWAAATLHSSSSSWEVGQCRCLLLLLLLLLVVAVLPAVSARAAAGLHPLLLLLLLQAGAHPSLLLLLLGFKRCLLNLKKGSCQGWVQQ
jgi:uncharacterized integral membrane protein